MTLTDLYKTFSLCESVMGTGKWHLRKLSAKGRKLGGGIDTPTLCGRTMEGWDLTPCPATHQGRDYVCIPCSKEWEKLNGG